MQMKEREIRFLSWVFLGLMEERERATTGRRERETAGVGGERERPSEWEERERDIAGGEREREKRERNFLIFLYFF